MGFCLCSGACFKACHVRNRNREIGPTEEGLPQHINPMTELNVFAERFDLTDFSGGYIIVKTKLIATNVNIAAVAAFGGLIVSVFYALFLAQHGLRLSVIAFVISLWGFLSLKHQNTPQPKRRWWRRIGITTALIVLMGGSLLFGTIKMITATQTAPSPACIEWPNLGCNKERQEKSPRPHPQPESHCIRHAAKLGESPFNKENSRE